MSSFPTSSDIQCLLKRSALLFSALAALSGAPAIATPATAQSPDPLTIIAPAAPDIDRTGAFPRAALKALGEGGLLGLISATDIGGMGLGHRAATLIVERIGRECASTALVVCMHYAATAVIEAHGPREIEETLAAAREAFRKV